MKILTVDQFEENFDEYFSKVENGETFLIESNHGKVLILPYTVYKNEIDELVQMYINHEEGS